MATKVVREGQTKYTGNDGKEYILDLSNLASEGDGYRTNNLFRRGTMGDLSKAIELMLKKGYIPSRADLIENDIDVSKGAYDNIKHDLEFFVKENNIDFAKYREDSGIYASEDLSDQELALDAYYRDIYSTDSGTGGDIYNNLVQAEQDAAISNMQLADANFQQQAMQQAQTVKAITDQVRSERVARLRAGMSESQIANQDMQMLMTNINTLNQQAADANVARLQAQQQYQNAQNTAYQAWLANANTMAQSGAAYAAADAGDIITQAQKYAAANKIPLADAIKVMQGSQQ